jgi:NAD(P)-dependent dehydrogenase (short-subunit alcohol dehydrogenase family)
MGVNFWGVVHGCRAFLPVLIERGGGHIVNTASTAGLLPGFGPANDASKHTVVAISESSRRPRAMGMATDHRTPAMAGHFTRVTTVKGGRPPHIRRLVGDRPTTSHAGSSS